ncbi:MAG: acyl-CoA thioesterase [Flavobacterium psychrophilum]|nr:MAG: acyl-CoA thioesterase [Flavobacterium psychrophilum]
MENKTFAYNLTIKEFHLDTFGHVNNATYLQIYEEARWEFITQNGYGLDKIKSSGKGPVILDIKIRFIKELGLRQNVIIYSQTGEYNGKVGKIKQWIVDEGGTVCSDVEMTIGLFDTRERKLVAPTDEWLAAIR